MKLDPKSIASNLLLVLGSMLITLLLLELTLRVVVTPELGDHGLFMEFDPVLGWRKIPNFAGRHVTTEYSILEQINSQAIRGPEYPVEKRDEEYRILVLGDSFAEGYTVEFPELFSEVMKAELNQASNRYVETINLGTGGYSTDQELLSYIHVGKKYDPDLTVLMFTDNDVWWNTESTFWGGSAKPYYQLAESGDLVLKNVPLTEPNRESEDPKSEFLEDPVDSIKSWFTENSHLYRFVRDRFDSTPVLFRAGVFLGVIEETSDAQEPTGKTPDVLPIPESYSVYHHTPSSEVRDAWKLTEALLLELQNETASSGSELLIFYVPGHASVHEEDWQEMKRSYGMTDESWGVDQIERGLMDLCGRHGLDCLNPTSRFRDQVSDLGPEGQRLYFSIDRHWNILGHKLAGKILAEYIETHYLASDRVD